MIVRYSRKNAKPQYLQKNDFLSQEFQTAQEFETIEDANEAVIKHMAVHGTDRLFENGSWSIGEMVPKFHPLKNEDELFNAYY
jgi:hypothetical protein